MKIEEMSIEARTVANLEEQLAWKEREILEALQASPVEEPPQDHNERGTLQ